MELFLVLFLIFLSAFLAALIGVESFKDKAVVRKDNDEFKE